MQLSSNDEVITEFHQKLHKTGKDLSLNKSQKAIHVHKSNSVTQITIHHETHNETHMITGLQVQMQMKTAFVSESQKGKSKGES